MEATEQTRQQLERFINKVAEKFHTQGDDAGIVTDIHFRLGQESGEIVAYDDDDAEITRCVVDQWIGSTDDSFFDEASTSLQSLLKSMSPTLENMSVLKPFSFVLENDEGESLAELYLVDDDIAIIDSELMADLDTDLDLFLEHLLQD